MAWVGLRANQSVVDAKAGPAPATYHHSKYFVNILILSSIIIFIFSQF